MSLFTEKLKQLRGRITVDELADSTGVSVTSIYKAEQGGGVKWNTIRRIYDQFLSSDEDRLETLVLWAIDITQERFAERDAMKMARGVVSEEGKMVAEASSELTQILAGMHPDDREILMEFSRRFANFHSTRLMARTWVKVMEEQGGSDAEEVG